MSALKLNTDLDDDAQKPKLSLLSKSLDSTGADFTPAHTLAGSMSPAKMKLMKGAVADKPASSSLAMSAAPKKLQKSASQPALGVSAPLAGRLSPVASC